VTDGYEGLLHTPATDLNFISGIERLNNCDLTAMLERLEILKEQGERHEGRIEAVKKELASRGGAVEPKWGRKAKTGENSREIVAMDKYKVDIDTAEQLYGDGMPYEKDRIENEIKFYMAQTAQSLFESGKRYLRIKAHEDDCSFEDTIKRIGVPHSSAYYAMAVVIKFGPVVQTFGQLGTSKLQVLTVFEEEDIKSYVSGGPLGSIPHDDVEKMSVRDLKAAIREERKKRKDDIASREKVISEKEDKINEMDKRLRGQEPPTQEQLAAVSLEPLKKKLFEQVLLVQFHLDEAVKAVVAAQKVEGATFPQLKEWAMAHYEQLAPIGELFEELDKALVNCGPYNPESTGM